MQGQFMQSGSNMQDQAAQVISLPSPRDAKPLLAQFAGNGDHLQALEYEAKLMAAVAALRNTASRSNDDGDPGPRFPFLAAGTDVQQAAAMLDAISTENRTREALSLQSGVQLNFLEFCATWSLDSVERTIIMLLLMQFSSPAFFATYQASRLERNCDNGMEIGAILLIISRNLGGQLENRRYFNIHGTLLGRDLLHANHNYVDSTTSILRMSVYLYERFVRHILGDENQYHAAFRFIRQERPCVSLDQVVLPDQVKQDVVTAADQYLAGRRNGTFAHLDHFFGYGTGMTLLFHGPSGTGKTMLAKGLAHHLDCPLVSLSLEDMRKIELSDDEILAMLFREAALLGGIVFLDECDDLFGRDNSSLSRSLLLEVEKSHCITIIATNRPLDLDPAMERRFAMKVQFQLPDADLRQRMWRALVPPTVTLAPDVDFAHLAERYHFTGGLIKNCILMAMISGGDKSILTKSALEHAAIHQTATMGDLSRLRERIDPVAGLDEVPLHPVQRDQLRGIARAWEWLRGEQLGFNLLVSCDHMQTGISAMCGLAAEIGITVQAFDLSRVTSLAEDDKVMDMVSQRRISPIKAAFLSAAPGVMTLFIDHSGEVLRLFEAIRDNKILSTYDEIFTQLRKSMGLFCLLTKQIGTSTIPVEFHQMINLRHPPEELQMQQWEKSIGRGILNDSELVRVVETYPMHLPEIDFIARQAKVKAIMSGRTIPGAADVTEIISGYRGSKRQQVLFGGRV